MFLRHYTNYELANLLEHQPEDPHVQAELTRRVRLQQWNVSPTEVEDLEEQLEEKNDKIEALHDELLKLRAAAEAATVAV